MRSVRVKSSGCYSSKWDKEDVVDVRYPTKMSIRCAEGVMKSCKIQIRTWMVTTAVIIPRANIESMGRDLTLMEVA